MVVYIQAHLVHTLVGGPNPVESGGADDEEVVAWGAVPQGLVR